MICEDDPGILEVMKIMLEESGYEVKALSDGRGIQKKVSEYSPDILLLDLWMPGIDGKEITKILKRDPILQKIPIVIISALNKSEIEKIQKEAGADSFLPKPFDLKDLTQTIEKFTQN